jgi:type VI secretion system protein ImpC
MMLPAMSTIRKEEPFRVALLGNWTGGRNHQPIGTRKPISVDRDNYDAVLKKCGVRIETAAGAYAISDLDDFHPDAIYSTLPVFESLREARTRPLPGPVQETRVPEALDAPRASSGSLLDDIVGESDSGAATAARPAMRPTDDLQRFVQEVVRPYLTARPDPRAADLIRKVDDSASELMRSILHDPKFQSVEASWRTLFQLVRGLETSADLKVFLIDVTKEELAGNARQVYELLVERSGPWAVVAADFTFGAEDIGTLTSLGRIAAKLEAPLLGEADLSLLEGSAAWAEFRRSPEAAHIGLALPRVLLRLPYGKDTSSCDTFDFEEIEGTPEVRQMLWGNPALFCAMLLGQSFESKGWHLRPGSVREVGGLPVFVYREDGEPQALPCAEIPLTESTAEALIEAGFMPVAAERDRDTVRVLQFQSVREPASALPGRWN